MEDGTASNTARMVAALRAHHCLTTPEPRILSDTLAMDLAEFASPAEVDAYVESLIEGFSGFAGRAQSEGMIAYLRIHVLCRSRLVEERLAASRARGMRQLVVLGAGLDTLAWRAPELTAGLDVFEIDHPATQSWKRERLAAAGIGVPPRLRFVPVDFERQTLAEALAEGGVRADAMTFFSWLGVQPYLTHEAVVATLDTIAQFSPGSELAMDLITPGSAGADEAVVEGARDRIAKAGEAFKTLYPAADFEALLRERGFTAIEMHALDEWLRTRFGDRFPTQPGPVKLVTAQVA